MKMYKRALVLLASVTALSTTMPLCANTVDNMMTDISSVARVEKAAAKDKATQDTVRPVINSVTVEKKDGKVYLVIDATDDKGIKHVTVDGEAVSSKTNGYYRKQVTRSKEYRIVAVDINDNESEARYKRVDLSAEPTLSLSKSTSGKKTILKITANDDGTIKKVTVNGDKISFPESGGTQEYKIEKSGKYTVVVTDNDGKETEESITINLNNDEPTLKLDKKYVNGKCYLVIDVKPNDGNRISSVKVNKKSVSCDKKGGTIEYEVTSTGTYKVVVTDSEGLEAEKSLYVDVNASNNAPVLKLSVNSVGSVQYLVINVKDNGSISKLTVNGNKVSISSGGGVINYPVTATGNYKVVATDNEGNETTQEIFVSTLVAPTPVPTPNYAGGTHTIIFKLNSSSYTVDGVTSTMDSAVMAKNNRTYIPLRYVSNALGIPAGNIKWDGPSKTVIIQDGSNVVKVPLGKKAMSVNGQSIAMDSPAIQVNGRVMVPISQVAKAFTSRNVKLDWQPATKQVVITRR